MERTLLIVDDEKNILKALTRLLRCDGYRILTAGNAYEGLQLLGKNKVDVIISDQRMPHMTGVAFLSQARDQYPDTVRIVLSAYSDFSAISEAISKGAVYNFFAKPWDDELMRANVKEAFRRVDVNWKNNQLTRVFESTIEGIMITDTQGIIRVVNPAFTAITGYEADEVTGQTARILHSGRQDKQFYKDMWQSLLTIGHWQGEIWNRRKNGEVYPELLAITEIVDSHGKAEQYVALFNDITEQKKSEERVAYQAYHDALTDLPNRLLFNDRLDIALAHAKRNKQMLAVMFLDMDRFKNVNDSLGHPTGDLLLKRVAERLTQSIRNEDTVARLGGDEFTVLLSQLMDTNNAAEVAEKILDAFKKPLDINGRELFITASIGISIFPNDSQQAESLMKNADTAMYRAKDCGRNNYQFYSPTMNAKALERLALENKLRFALERGEFLLHYQPQMDLYTGQIIGMEALLRWNTKEWGLVSPVEFIPLLEETGLILQVGEWVLKQACAQNRAWQAAGYPSMRIAVNLSTRQFVQQDLVRSITEILEETGLSPQYLELEVTESIMMDAVSEKRKVLETLKQTGLQIAVDDFGTGYSSLSYLKRLPIDSIKIDQSFVQDMACDLADAAIVETIIALAHNLKHKVIAEGVETDEQLAMLRKLKCNEIQGYLISRPMPAELVMQWLDAWSPTACIAQG